MPCIAWPPKPTSSLLLRPTPFDIAPTPFPTTAMTPLPDPSTLVASIPTAVPTSSAHISNTMQIGQFVVAVLMASGFALQYLIGERRRWRDRREKRAAKAAEQRVCGVLGR